jgi:NTP pyrophosphatase (non-canonical NTP hydrolase)
MPGAKHQYAIGSGSWPGMSKLLEEMGELTQVLGKIIAMGGDIQQPHWDGSDLRTRLLEEMGDAKAALQFFAEVNGLDGTELHNRAAEKHALFWKWQQEDE